MKPQKVYLDSVVSKSRNHVVRVKVMKKRTYDVKEGKQKFQRLDLVDEKGLTMRAAIFGQNVDYFDDIIHKDKCYDISNIVVTSVGKNFANYPDEKQIHINSSTSIKKLDAGIDTSPMFHNYTRISELPHNDCPPNATFDVLAIVLDYIPPKKVTNRFSADDADLTELQITDDSCSEILTVTLWNQYAFGLETLSDISPRNAIISLRGLRVKYTPRFSLTTCQYTTIELMPTGSKAEALRKWFEDNYNNMLIRFPVFSKKKHPSDLPINTIQSLLDMKPTEVSPADVLKIAAYVPEFNANCLRLSICCKWCGKSCANILGEEYQCSSCEQYSIATAKLFFDFTATDGTGTFKLGAHTRTAENLLKTKASIIHAMTTEERHSFIDKVAQTLRTEKTHMLLSPVTTILQDHGILRWTLKDIVQPPST